LVNKSPGRQMLLPGAGVGGHCIPKDPWLLVYSVMGKDVPLRVIPAARIVNNSMPKHVAELLIKALASNDLEINGSRILVFGYSYLEESDDARNSPSVSLVDFLVDRGAEVLIHDPFVPGYQGSPEAMVDGCDAMVMMVKHNIYMSLDLPTLKAKMRTPILVDARRVFSLPKVKEAGLSYWAVGVDEVLV
jgi:UDP-N-acetyl-D-mannosaminuronic acid dehydrogenase